MLASCVGEQGKLPPLQASPVIVLTSATLPPLALMFTVPIASGVGSAGADPVPAAICTSRYCPGAKVALIGVTALEAKVPVPVALAYCTDQPLSEKAVELRLKSSTKSFLWGAAVFPPPP
ncbi:MAG TPA: hypothetical protein VF881_10900 [Polyangiaceae bacterium]